MNTIEFSPNGIGSISKALVALRSTLKPLVKGNTNPHFGSKYASLEDVLHSVNDALTDAEIAPIQGTAANEDGSILIETMLLHGPSAEWVKTGITLRPSKNDPQGAGSCITYGRRYTLQAILAIAAEDDDGNAASQPQAPQGSTAREYKLNYPFGAVAQPPSPEASEGQWVEGLFGPVDESKDGGAWFSAIGGQRIWTKDSSIAASMRVTREKVKAHIRKKLPESKSAQLLSFVPLGDDYEPGLVP